MQLFLKSLDHKFTFKPLPVLIEICHQTKLAVTITLTLADKLFFVTAILFDIGIWNGIT